MKLKRFNAELTSCNHPDNSDRLVRDGCGAFVKFDDYMELQKVTEALLEWIDAVPADTALPAMPGVDRDWVESVLYKTKGK